MPQTPKSVSANLSGSNVTLYTVPANTTAVVKTALAANVLSGTSTITVQKVSGGIPYPLTIGQFAQFTNATGGNSYARNLLDGPVTLAAGESITAFDSANPQFKFPQTSTRFIPTESASYAARNMLFGNGIYVMVCRDETNGKSMVLRSTDAATWTEIATGNRLSVVNTYYMARNGSTWVIAEHNTQNYMYSTDNALTWTAASLGSAGAGIFDVESDGTSRFVFCTRAGIYTSTALPTTTLNTAYNTLLNVSALSNVPSAAPQVASWNGTYWFISNYYGTFYTTDFSNYTALYSTQGGSINQSGGVRWSSNYSKFYSCGRINSGSGSTDAICSSTDGFNWSITQLSSTALTSQSNGKVVNAGGTLLLAKTVGTNAILKSTNGTTWTSTTEIGGYTDLIEGLGNGYFLTCSNTNSTYRISTDPTVSGGTAWNVGVNPYSTNDFTAAASNGTGWVLFYYDYTDGGTYREGGSSFTSRTFTGTASGMGYVTQVVWYPAASVYVATNGSGFWTSSDGNTWTNRSSYSFSSCRGMTVQNNILYVYSTSGGNAQILRTTASDLLANVGWTSSALSVSAYSNLGTQITSFSMGTNNCGMLSANPSGTDILITGSYGETAIYQPSINPLAIKNPVGGGVFVERVNSLDIVYTGYGIAGSNTRGFFYGSNIVTTLPTNNTAAIPGGTWCTGLHSSPVSNINKMGNRVIYYNSLYWTVAENSNAMSYASNIKLFTSYTMNNSSIGGVNFVLPAFSDSCQNRIGTDGTNFLTYNTATNSLIVFKGTNPLGTLVSAAITLGLIENT